MNSFLPSCRYRFPPRSFLPLEFGRDPARDGVPELDRDGADLPEEPEEDRFGLACGRDPPERGPELLLPERLLLELAPCFDPPERDGDRLGCAPCFDPPERDGDRLGCAPCFDPPEREAGGRAWLPPREFEPDGCCRTVDRGVSLRVVFLGGLAPCRDDLDPVGEVLGTRTFRPGEPERPVPRSTLLEPAPGAERSWVVRGAAALRYRSRTRSALSVERPRPG